MIIRLLNTSDQLDAIADDWDRLAAGHPMRGHDWLAGWWRHYAEGELFVLAAYDEATDELIGLAPWRMETGARLGRVIRWLGDGEVCTDHLTLLTAEGAAPRVSAAIADFLSDEFLDWDLLQLDDTDAADPRLAALVDALTERDCRLQARDAGACWSIELPADWEEFLARQSKSHRKQLRRAERRVLESDTCHWRPVETAEQLQEAWPLFIDLHQRRRQSLGEPGCFASARFEAFHRELSTRLLERGQLRMSWVEMEDQGVAAELHFASDDAVLAYQGGVDPDRLEDEPGRLSNIATIKAAIEEGASRFDFLRGDEPYKAHWRAEPQATVHLRFVPPRRKAQLIAGADLLVGALKSGVKALRAE